MIKDRVLALYDSHYPYNLSLTQFLNFAKDFKPTVFILGGDNWDLGFISHWNSKLFRKFGFDQLRKDLKRESKGMMAQLDTFRNYMPKAEFIYLEGNHEHWITEFGEDYEQMEDFSLEYLLKLKSRGIELFSYTGNDDTCKVGKLYFKHGHQYGSSNPAKQAVERSKKSIVIGHHHGYSEYFDYSDTDCTQKWVGIQVPCFRNRDADYLMGRPNKWATGFFSACIKPSGNFSHHVQLVDSNGEFTSQMAKEYK